MMIIAKVIDVEAGVTSTGKPSVNVSLRSGKDLFIAPLYSNEIEKNTHKEAAKHLGQTVVIDIIPEAYGSGKMRYSFGYNPQFVTLANYAAMQADKTRPAVPAELKKTA